MTVNGNGRRRGRVAFGRAFARKAARRIAAAVRPDRIILFGSYAYGSPTRDSDIDLLVVGPSRRRWTGRMVELDMLIPERPIGIDFVYLTPREVERRLRDFDPFLEEILSRGLVLHASNG